MTITKHFARKIWKIKVTHEDRGFTSVMYSKHKEIHKVFEMIACFVGVKSMTSNFLYKIKDTMHIHASLKSKTYRVGYQAPRLDFCQNKHT